MPTSESLTFVQRTQIVWDRTWDQMIISKWRLYKDTITAIINFNIMSDWQIYLIKKPLALFDHWWAVHSWEPMSKLSHFNECFTSFFIVLLWTFIVSAYWLFFSSLNKAASLPWLVNTEIGGSLMVSMSPNFCILFYLGAGSSVGNDPNPLGVVGPTCITCILCFIRQMTYSAAPGWWILCFWSAGLVKAFCLNQ